MEIEDVWADGLREAAKTLWNLDLAETPLEPPADPKFGDATTSLAFKLAKELKKSPRAIAQEISEALAKAALPYLARTEVAGAGYLNFVGTPELSADTLRKILAEGPQYGRSAAGAGRAADVEHCSANPTGPLHIAHGRQAAVGDALARVLEFAGWRVTREFYINDTGTQIENLGKSIFWRIHEFFGRTYVPPENAYHGEYVREMAAELRGRYGESILAKPDAVSICSRFGKERLLEGIRKDLEEFRVRYDVWSSQEELEAGGAVAKLIADFKARGIAYEKDGALFFRATDYGDLQDWVFVKRDGTLTYHAPDITYHDGKFRRGHDLLIDLWGPDHDAHIRLVAAGLKALGHVKEGSFRVLIVQHCRLLRGGQEVKMSKRAASYVTLRELMEEVGVDATRYFFIMRKTNSHLDFDIDVAVKRSLENPVYYSQYAHARISSIFAKGVEKGLVTPGDLRDGLWCGAFEGSALGDAEIPLVRLARGLGRTVEAAARDLDPALVADFAYRLSGGFQRYYQDKKNMVLCEDAGVRSARLAACSGVKQVLRNAFALLGVSAPERLESSSTD